MMDSVHAAVGRIHLPGPAGAGADLVGGNGADPGPVAGAGFLVGADLLVTCAHVLGRPPRVPVLVCFPQAPGRPTTWAWSEPGAWHDPAGEDVAFLRLGSAPPGIPVLRLRSSPGAAGSLLRGFGFPDQAPLDGHPGTAHVGRLFTAAGVTLLGLEDANALAQGFSGSPLVDRDGWVVGMVTAHPGADAYDRGHDLAYATPAGVLQRLGPGLETTLECPYPGLFPFTSGQARWYHGRGRSVDALVDRLRTHRGVVALLGPSGSGKSSLIAAGLLPALTYAALPGITGRDVEVMHPGTDPAAIADALDSLCVGTVPRVLVIDQFEEILVGNSAAPRGLPGAPPPVTVGPGTANTETVARVVAALERLSAGDAPVWIVLVLRDDFYPQLARRSPALIEHLTHGRILQLTDTLTPDDLHDIIVEPARSQNWNVDPVLVDRLSRDMLDPPTRAAPLTDLPLLALTLRRIWETAVTPLPTDEASVIAGGGAVPAPGADAFVIDNTLTAAQYDTVGGLRTAFASWCDQAYRAVPAAEQALARSLLTALVQDADPGRGTPAVRRRRMWDDLSAPPVPALVGGPPAEATANAGAVLDELVRERILTTGRDQRSGRVVVELAHDTLIDHWDALRVWRDQDRDRRRWLDRVEDRAHYWENGGRRRGLLEDDELAEAHRNRLSGPTPDLVTAYIEASEAGRRARARTRRVVQAALAGLTILALVVAGIALVQYRAAVRARDDAVLNQVVAEADQVRSTDPSLAAQLDLVAHRMDPTADSVTRLLSTAQVALADPLVGHAGAVYSVAWSPDRKTLASGSDDETVRLWDVADRAHPTSFGRPLTGPTDDVDSVAWSPDGKTLASGSEDRTVRLWDVADPAHPTGLGVLTGHQGAVRSVAWSPDGKTLASGSDDETVRLWDVADPAHPTPLGVLTGHGGEVDSVAWSPDGKTLASGSEDRTVRLWDVADPAHPTGLGVLTGHQGAVRSVAWSPDGKTLASGSVDATVRLWDVADPANPTLLGQPLTGRTSFIYAVAWSPDGHTLAGASFDGTVQLWSIANPADPVPLAEQELTGHTGAVFTVAWSPDGTTLASGSDDHTVRLWNPPATVMTGHTGAVESVAWSPNGKTLASGGVDQTVRLWDVADPAHPFALGQPLTGHGGAVFSVAWSPDGKTLASGSGDETVRLWDVADPAHPLALGQPLTGYTGAVRSVAWSPDGKTLAGASDDHTVRLWDVADPAHPTALGVLIGHTGAVDSVAWSPDGTILASGSGTGDHTVRLWDVADPAHPTPLGLPLTGHTAGAVTVAWSPDGRTLASGSVDETVRLWDVADPAHPTRLGRTLAGHTGEVESVAWSPDGKTLASAADDETVRLWDVSDPAHPTSLGVPLTGHTGEVGSVAWSPDGRSLASASFDDTVRLWDLDVDHAIDRICASTSLGPEQWAADVSDVAYDPPCDHYRSSDVARSP